MVYLFLFLAWSSTEFILCRIFYTHEKCCLDIKSVEAEEFCLINDSQCQKKQCWLSFSVVRGPGRQPGWRGILFPWLIHSWAAAQTASKWSISGNCHGELVMWMFRPSAYFTRAFRKRFLFRKAGPEAVSKPEKSHLYFLSNPNLNNVPLCHLFKRGFFSSIFSNDESKSTNSPSNIAEPGKS